MTTTLSQLREECRVRADMEESRFVEDPDLDVLINDSYGELYDLLVAKQEDYFVEDPEEFTVDSGDDSADLPDGFYKAIGVDYQIATGSWVEIRKFNFRERNNKSRLLTGRFHPRIRYRIVGDKIIFTPADQAAGTYRIWQVKNYTPLSADDDAIDLQCERWKEYIVVDTAIKMLDKEESDTTALERRKAYLIGRIEVMAQNRDSGESERITDVRTDYDEPWGDL